MDPGNAHEYLPLSRNPWAYVSPGSSYTPVKPMDPAQGRRDIAEASTCSSGHRRAGGLPEKGDGVPSRCLGTALGPDRLYDDGINSRAATWARRCSKGEASVTATSGRRRRARHT